MKEYRLWFNLTGVGYCDVMANSLEEAIEKEKNGKIWSGFEMCDDVNWEFDEFSTRSENSMND